ncbi:hypothetical protein LVY74_00435 [Acinetobacter sp. ME22]|uniref:hypothetical protein n=1 Tax=Acinetobacter sp. ME22 TaxID=2904802 RepID=UPI001EDAEE18|nr:hypothetical protein [Acinetobacter sp. ME22]MCG2572026.1 hypothetical protein [Acinetobacter sp. ME22]
MAIGDSGLRYDGDGFLMGEEISQKVGTIDQNVIEILKLLQAETGEQTRHFQITKLQRAMYEAQNAQNFERLINQVTKRTEIDNQSQRDAIDRLERAIQDQNHGSETQSDSNSESGSKSGERQRDSNGRFISEHTSNDANPKRNTPNRDEKGRFIAGEAKTVSKFTDVVGKFGQTVSGFGADTHGIDPTVDALHELGTALSPVKRMAGLVFKPLTGLAKMRKRSEPLPKEQVEHNKKELRLLNEIADQSGEQSSSGLSKLFKRSPFAKLLGFGKGKGRATGRRGRLGRLARLGKLSKLLKVGRGIPFLGAALTALSFADWNEQTTAEKGGTVGALAGGSIGAIVGSFAGPIGTVVGGMVGAWVGDKLGTTVAPYFKSWTDSLARADIPKYVLAKWSEFVDTVTQWFSHAWKSVKDGVGDFKNKTKDKITNGWNTTKAFVDRVFGGAQVTPNAKNAAKIISRGAGFTTLQLEDGSIVRRGGSPAWRNNNFGNLNYGNRAKRFGAIGEDSNGFAVFPNAEAGMKAHEDLLFNGHAKSSLREMVKSYAPKDDPRGKNDPEGYWRFIMQEAGVTDKRMADYSKEERQRIMKAMYKKEGVHAGPEQVLKQAVQAPEVESAAAGEAYTSAAVSPQSSALIAKDSNSAAATRVAPIQIPKTTAPKIESLTARVNSSGPQKVMVVDQNDMSMIAQDIGDPQLAMALTGGIGRA